MMPSLRLKFKLKRSRKSMASQFVFDAIGTHWVIDIYNELTKEKENILLVEINNRIKNFDQTYSRFRDDSLVTVMSKKIGKYPLPDDAPIMFNFYRKLYDITKGLVTPLIGQVLVDAGYDAEYSLEQKKTLESPLTWDEVMVYEHPYLDIQIPVLLDFGAAGKGYLIDLVSQVLEQKNIDSFCIDAGGDMLYKNKDNKPLSVGLEHPDDTSKVIGIVSITNQSLCGSAGNRRVWKNFHHIINPQTLLSPKNILAIWTIAESTIIADGLTTALFFTSPEILVPHFNFKYFILYADYSFKKSSDFKTEIFC